VKKTGKLFCVSYGYWTGDFSGHIMAMAAMLAPGTKMWRITYPDAAPPFSTAMNAWMMPDAPKIVDAVQKFLKM
jgi:pyruvate/2-oxoglutarate/acetoin dehydrogenase E1 component